MPEEDEDTPLEGEVVVEYCKTCGLPYDYCDFGGKWSLCKELAMQKYPKLYTEGHIGNEEKKKAEKKSSAKNTITIQRCGRAKRKVVTVITGLDLFGVKLDVASKLFSKQLATGVSVVKGIPGQQDKIDVQGDVESIVIQLIEEFFPTVPSDKIVVLPPKA